MKMDKKDSSDPYYRVNPFTQDLEYWDSYQLHWIRSGYASIEKMKKETHRPIVLSYIDTWCDPIYLPFSTWNQGE